MSSRQLKLVTTSVALIGLGLINFSNASSNIAGDNGYIYTFITHRDNELFLSKNQIINGAIQNKAYSPVRLTGVNKDGNLNGVATTPDGKTLYLSSYSEDYNQRYIYACMESGAEYRAYDCTMIGLPAEIDNQLNFGFHKITYNNGNLYITLTGKVNGFYAGALIYDTKSQRFLKGGKSKSYFFAVNPHKFDSGDVINFSQDGAHYISVPQHAYSALSYGKVDNQGLLTEQQSAPTQFYLGSAAFLSPASSGLPVLFSDHTQVYYFDNIDKLEHNEGTIVSNKRIYTMKTAINSRYILGCDDSDRKMYIADISKLNATSKMSFVSIAPSSGKSCTHNSTASLFVTN
ncbi:MULTISPECIES: hypothetical protein [Cysteiniphilum]|uniref:hypothetical protein n=1 Tax=Cysteiniphilum TaxID=2056696 RepID=UPI00177F9632|nr:MULTISPECIES: hypothetical protein [Cysteiniphilum]